MSQKLFNRIHQNHLIYNICWEDPRVDRKAMRLDQDSRILMITSAGCNALDYLLDNPEEIHCVDLNPAQNALLELKIAAIKCFEYKDYYQLIGLGGHRDIERRFGELEAHMSGESAAFWRSRLKRLAVPGYIQRMGTCGLYGRLCRGYFRVTGLHKTLNRLLAEGDSQKAAEIFDQKVMRHPALRLVKAAMDMSRLSYLLGVPRTQVNLLEGTHRMTLGNFIRDAIRSVAVAEHPDNYFYHVYLNGAYTPEALPDYLKPDNFDTLRARVDRIQATTGDLAEYACNNPHHFSHLVLLDHMDWLSEKPEQLHDHFTELNASLQAGGRLLWRSAATYEGFLALIKPVMRDSYTLDQELAESLHQECRVKTYGSMFIADKQVFA
ncbi:Uncharacterised protein [BD1-7 clade bacterium]|uniref:S-adenosylmethionine--diacylglycerol 3-amino-3-carboxypropyl transferase n=1 Tax=BD1-7 clade bacterium TaxID=2029982 RepID=A0A5S9QIY4_9GAMM|nr:Uncharacterised protein [BD1-7 clade bacterium]